MKRIYSIDGMKVIAAFLVICIHLPFTGQLGEIVKAIARVAVPYFFMVSGFFLWASNNKETKKKIVRSIKRVAKYTLLANLFYFGWELLLSILSNGTVVEYLQKVFSIESIGTFLLFNESPFANHLWYLTAYLCVLIVYYFVIRFDKRRYAFLSVPFLLIIGLILGKYSLVVLGTEISSILVRNFIFIGTPYFFLGNYIRVKYEQNKVNLNNAVLVFGMVVTSFTTILEKFWLDINGVHATGDVYISTTFLVVFLFMYLINNPMTFKDSWLIKLSPYTLYIYIIHPFIITLFKEVISGLPDHLGASMRMAGPLFIFFFSLLVSILYAKGKEEWEDLSTEYKQLIEN